MVGNDTTMVAQHEMEAGKLFGSGIESGRLGMVSAALTWTLAFEFQNYLVRLLEHCWGIVALDLFMFADVR